MCYDAACLGYSLLFVIVGFALLIFVVLRYRKWMLQRNLKISPDQVWDLISHRAQQHNLQKSDLFFGIYQDQSLTVNSVHIKDSHGEKLGRIEHHLGSRKLDINLGSEHYIIEFPLTWRKTALLKKMDGKVLAVFKKLPYSLLAHRIEIPGQAPILSKTFFLKRRFPFEYLQEGRVIGITQQLSSRPVGCCVLFKKDFPVIEKVFILAMHSFGVL